VAESETEREHVLEEEPEHHSSLIYWVVWIALAFFTWLTWFTGTKHYGAWALPIALAIAVTKSTLVILFFMHLWNERGANRIVIVTAFMFVLLLILLTVADFATRFPLATPASAPFGTDVPAQVEKGRAPEHQPSQGPVGRPSGIPEPSNAPPGKSANPAK
jgi:cytochrome c oxidase subunit 4